MSEIPADVRYRHVATARAPVEVVWDLLVDHARYADWSFVLTSRLVKEGSPDPNGLGAVRFLGAGPFGSTEEIVAFEPARLLGYRIIGGLPISSYRAEVELEPTADATRIIWTGGVSRGPKPLRRALTDVLGAFPRRFALALAKAAEARSS